MAILRDGIGNIIGRTEETGSKTLVKDPHGKLLGWTNSSGTYDYAGRRISTDEIPGLLLG